MDLGASATTILGFKLTPRIAVGILVFVVSTTLGLHYISVGKKESDVGKMVSGLILVLLGLFLAF